VGVVSPPPVPAILISLLEVLFLVVCALSRGKLGRLVRR
jgi:hypothetical protein